MAIPKPLAPTKLFTACKPAQFNFKTTATLSEPGEAPGQERATEAIEFGLGIQHPGYNLLVMGSSGMSKRRLLQRYLEKLPSAKKHAFEDWVYVFNFETEHQPTVLRLPQGKGQCLKTAMESLVEDLENSLPATFESDEYRARRQEIEAKFAEQENIPLDKLRTRALKKNIALLKTPQGLTMAPLADGEVLEPEAFQKLPEAERNEIQSNVELLQKELEDIVGGLPKIRRQLQHAIRDLNEQFTRVVTSGLTNEIKADFKKLPEVLAYLDAAQDDIVDNLRAFLPSEEDFSGLLIRYRVNTLVDHTDSTKIPVVFEDNPTFANLVGRIEHLAEMGALITDFTLIKPGALHRANGGYLVIDASGLLSEPYAWQGLKRALLSRQIQTESLGQATSMITTISLEPEPIPLDVKVVLVGERHLFYMLGRHDSDFTELFKVVADLEEEMPRNPTSLRIYAQLIGSIARRENLKALDRNAVCRVIEHTSRLADDSQKLSLHSETLSNLLMEADHFATQDKKRTIQRTHVNAALEAQKNRLNRIPNVYLERFLDGTTLLDTTGEKVGQINGLVVMDFGSYSIGAPSRITVRTRKGGGNVVNVEREANMSGKIHSKGTHIVHSWISATFAEEDSLSMTATLAFEQSYGGIDGDSASSTEIYAILSSLSDLPINQGIAVTGSVNQFGEIQVIGGVNEKIEGFFDICYARGLTGGQGCIIPESNVRHLMLKQEVIDAVKAGDFRIWAINTIEQGIEILTGTPAGKRLKNGSFQKDSVYARVSDKLANYSDKSNDKD